VIERGNAREKNSTTANQSQDGPPSLCSVVAFHTRPAAAEIYRDGYAKEVWLTQPLEPGAAMEGLHLPYAGEQEYSRMVLIEKGVRPAIFAS